MLTRRSHGARRASYCVLVAILGVLFLVTTATTVSASYTTSQIAWDDDPPYSTYSIYISCTSPQCSNQYGQSTYQCVATPWTLTQDYNWWWVGHPIIYRYSTTNCTGSPFANVTLSIGSSNPNPWFCYNTTWGQWQC